MNCPTWTRTQRVLIILPPPPPQNKQLNSNIVENAKEKKPSEGILWRGNLQTEEVRIYLFVCFWRDNLPRLGMKFCGWWG